MTLHTRVAAALTAAVLTTAALKTTAQEPAARQHEGEDPGTASEIKHPLARDGTDQAQLTISGSACRGCHDRITPRG